MTRSLVPLICLSLLPAAPAADGPTKWVPVEGVVNQEPGYMLRVSVDKPNRVYYDGEEMKISVVAEKDCYLYLLYYSGDNVGVLFPNKFHQDNVVAARRDVAVPSPGAKFKIVCRPPFGTEVLHAVATLQPVDLFHEKNFKAEPITLIGQQDLQQMASRVQMEKPEAWAEARIQITTAARSQQPQITQRQAGRFAVCVGISEYHSDRITPLQVSHRDAERMAEALKQQCGVTDVTLLTNQQATRAAIERAIFKELVAKSRPGDTVFIYFSGHGGRCPDTNGDEEDGLDEYLVPHDGVLGKPETMIVDDTFARWMQELDGREIGIILDNCYSGGSSKSVKGLAGPRLPEGARAIDFFDGELRRAKDLGQANTAVIAACQANQLAWEMPSADEGSVLTYHLLQSLKDPRADANHDGKLTLSEAFRFTQSPIQKYVRQTFSAEQTPVYIDNARDRLIFKP